MKLSRRDVLRSGLGASGGLAMTLALGRPDRRANAQSATVSAKGKKLRLLTFTGPGTHPAFTQQILSDWAKANGATLDSITVPFDQLSNKVMSTIIAQDRSVDMFYVDSGFFPLVAGGLEPLDPFIERDKVDLSHIGKQLINLYSKGGKRYSIPHESDTPFLIYRSDLFGSVAEQQAFKAQHGKDLKPPTTFDELVTVSHFFTRKAGATANGKKLTDDLYGCSLCGKTYISTSRQWEMFLYGYGGQVLDDKYKPVLNQKPGQEALAFYADMALKWKVTQPSMTSDGAPEVDVYLNKGRAATAAVYPSGVPNAPAPGVEFDAVPWYSATEKGWGIAINRLSSNKEIVWQMIKHLYDPQVQLQFGQMGGEPTRSDVLSNPTLVQQRPMLKALVEVHQRSHPQIQIPEISYIWGVESQPIDDVIANHMSVKSALDKTANQIEEVLKNAGYYD